VLAAVAILAGVALCAVAVAASTGVCLLWIPGVLLGFWGADRHARSQRAGKRGGYVHR
jgi:hypothetical protein